MEYESPKTVYQSFCDGCSQPKLQMTEMKLKGKKYPLHFCCEECKISIHQRIKEVLQEIPLLRVPQHLELEYSPYTNYTINPLEQLQDVEKMKEIEQMLTNLEKLKETGMVKNEILTNYHLEIMALANWFPVS